MTDDEIKQFVSAQTGNLAEPIAALCGQVITKGMQGIIEECVAMKMRIVKLEAQLAMLTGGAELPESAQSW